MSWILPFRECKWTSLCLPRLPLPTLPVRSSRSEAPDARGIFCVVTSAVTGNSGKDPGPDRKILNK